MEVTDNYKALAYFDVELSAAVKGFIVQAQVVTWAKFYKTFLYVIHQF
jgi:hypothetical protein